MEIRVRRIALKDDYTIGKMEILYPEGWRWVADTLEDVVRDINKDGDLNDVGEGKIYGKTAIPYGRYEITMKVQSPKFSKYQFTEMFAMGIYRGCSMYVTSMEFCCT